MLRGQNSYNVLARYYYQNKSNPLFNTACGYTDEETPCSISNQEAKLVLADDTIRYSDGESRSLQALLKFHNFPYNFQFKFYSGVFDPLLLLANKYCLINLKFYSLLRILEPSANINFKSSPPSLQNLKTLH